VLHSGHWKGSSNIKSQHVCCVFVFLLALPLFGAGAAYNQIDGCVAAIDGIKSYDVKFRIDTVFGFEESARHTTSTNRDVFAIGLGRRIENGIGNEKEYRISAISWTAAIASGKPLPKAITLALPGLTYYDYLNPIVGDFFLADLLRNQHSNISPLKASPTNPNMVGFQVDNPKLHGDFICVWLDAEHGYMPGKIEWHQRFDDNQLAIAQKMEVEKFVQLGNGAWVPARATNAYVVPIGSDAGRIVVEQTMELDAEHSSWNSIKSNELFFPKSLPKVNHEMDGWKQYYSPALLAAEEMANNSINEAEPGEHRHNLTIRIVFLAVCVLTLLPLMYMAYRSGQKPNL
jgi:hypothetical protein